MILGSNVTHKALVNLARKITDEHVDIILSLNVLDLRSTTLYHTCVRHDSKNYAMAYAILHIPKNKRAINLAHIN